VLVRFFYFPFVCLAGFVERGLLGTVFALLSRVRLFALIKKYISCNCKSVSLLVGFGGASLYTKKSAARSTPHPSSYM
jgi:hypothetical protein